MDIMLKVVGIAISSVVFTVLLKKVTPELGLLLVIMTGISVIVLLDEGLKEIVNSLEYLAEFSKIDHDLLAPVIKTVAVSVLTKITGELCRGAGEGGIAVFVEFSGTVVALMIAVPLIQGVLSLMESML